MNRRDFWHEIFMLNGSVTPYVLRRVAVFGLYSLIVCAIWAVPNFQFESDLAPYEVAGAVLGLLLVLRTNAGYDRWWEARVLWGGIVNQCRNFAISALTYGPDDVVWRENVVRWTAVFAHATRHSLRGERAIPKIRALLNADDADHVAGAQHMPSYVSARMASLLREAVQSGQLHHFAFLQIDKERATLIDHLGGCERILKTPLAKAYSIKIRRFLFLFMITLPWGLLGQAGCMTPLITMLVAYPLLSLDQIGIELENPFSEKRLSHLPLNDICQTIEENVLALIQTHDSNQATWGEAQSVEGQEQFVEAR